MNRYKILLGLIITTLLSTGCVEQRKADQKDITRPNSKSSEQKKQKAETPENTPQKKKPSPVETKAAENKKQPAKKEATDTVAKTPPAKEPTSKITEDNKPPVEESKKKEAPTITKKEPQEKKQEIKKETPPDADGAIVHQIIMPSKKKTGSSKFRPAVLRIRAGEYIEWINKDARTHFINQKPASYSAFSSYGDDDDDDDEEKEEKLDINSQVLQKGERWKHQFLKKGEIKYYCYTHPLEMFGTIIVE